MINKGIVTHLNMDDREMMTRQYEIAVLEARRDMERQEYLDRHEEWMKKMKRLADVERYQMRTREIERYKEMEKHKQRMKELERIRGMERRRQREEEWTKKTDVLRKEEKMMKGMEEEMCNRQRMLEKELEERIRSMEEKEKHLERERQEKQHQLEMQLKEMELKFAVEREMAERQHQQRLRELEMKLKLQWETKMKDLEHKLQKERLTAQEREEELMTRFHLENGEEAEREMDREPFMKEEIKSVKRRTENEKQRKMQKENERWQEMLEQMKRMEEKYEMDREMENTNEERWRELHEKREKEWKKRTRELRRELQETQQRVQKLLKLREEKQMASGEDEKWMELETTKRKRYTEEERLRKTSKQKTKESLRNEGKDFLETVEQEVVENKRESLIKCHKAVDEKEGQMKIKKNKREEEIKGEEERKKVERFGQLDGRPGDVFCKFEKKTVMENNTSEDRCEASSKVRKQPSQCFISDKVPAKVKHCGTPEPHRPQSPTYTPNPESTQPVNDLTLCSQAVDPTLTGNNFKSKHSIITVMSRPSDKADERSEWKEAEAQAISEGQVPQSSGNPSHTQTLSLDTEQEAEERKEEQGENASLTAAYESTPDVIANVSYVESDAGAEGVKKDKSVRRRVFGWVNKKVKSYYEKKIEKAHVKEEEAGDKHYLTCKISLIIISLYLRIFSNYASLIK